MIHDAANKVSGKSCTGNCSDSHGATSGIAASAASSDPTFPYPTDRGTIIGDTYRVFQATLNNIPTLTRACQSSDNTLNWEGEVPLCLRVTGHVIPFLRVVFSGCFSPPYNEMCVARSSVGDAGAGNRNVTKFFHGGHGHLPGSVERAEVLAGLSNNRKSVECTSSWDDYSVLINGNGLGTRVPFIAVCRLRQRGRVKQSSFKWWTERFRNIKWWVSVVSYEVVYALNPTAGGWDPFPHECLVSKRGSTAS